MNDLDLNLIPYLVAIEETRNVSRAAERLGVSQPRVSTALARLREYFNDPLFVRTSRGAVHAREQALASNGRVYQLAARVAIEPAAACGDGGEDAVLHRRDAECLALLGEQREVDLVQAAHEEAGTLTEDAVIVSQGAAPHADGARWRGTSVW